MIQPITVCSIYTRLFQLIEPYKIFQCLGLRNFRQWILKLLEPNWNRLIVSFYEFFSFCLNSAKLLSNNYSIFETILFGPSIQMGQLRRQLLKHKKNEAFSILTYKIVVSVIFRITHFYVIRIFKHRIKTVLLL